MRPNAFNPLCIVNTTLRMIQWKTRTHFPLSNTLESSQTHSLIYRHLLRRKLKYTPAPALPRLTAMPSAGNSTLRVAMRLTHKSISTTRLRRMESTNIFSVESRRNAGRRILTMCGRKTTPLCVSQASKMGMASKSLWLACPIIGLLGSGKYIVLRI
jgi:hypothetical protein